MHKSVLAEALLQSAGDAIIATDTKGTITLWNAGATRIFVCARVQYQSSRRAQVFA